MLNTASMDARLRLAQQMGDHHACDTDDPGFTMAIPAFERKMDG
jgi:hypothetical protein